MAVGRRSQARLEMLGRRGANRRRARANAPFVALAATLVLGVVVGILHNRSRTHHHSDPVLSSARTALAPVQTATFRAHAAVTGNSLPRGWQWPWAESALARENARLQAEVARLKVKAEQMRADADEAVRLRAAAGFARKQRKPPLVAPVIGLPPSPLFDTLTLGRGGLREGQVVRTPDGLIGQISEAGPLSSTVLLLCDPGSGVGGGHYGKTRTSRARCGTAEERTMAVLSARALSSETETTVPIRMSAGTTPPKPDETTRSPARTSSSLLR
jgi:hypothetical protein